MNHAGERKRCWLCEKHRSGHAPHDQGWSAQICRRPECAESKRLLKRILQKISESNSNVAKLDLDIHHYHHFSQNTEANPSRTHMYSSELHGESLTRNT